MGEQPDLLDDVLKFAGRALAAIGLIFLAGLAGYLFERLT